MVATTSEDNDNERTYGGDDNIVERCLTKSQILINILSIGNVCWLLGDGGKTMALLACLQ